MTKDRKLSEKLIYDVMDALDPTGANSGYWKEKFATMNDKEFLDLVKKDMPFRFQVRPFEIEPDMTKMEKAAKVLDIPILERVSLGYIYKDKNGKPLMSKPCAVLYIPIKRLKQMVTTKNSMSTSITDRDMKTGLLTGDDKGGKTSDREMEALALLGLEKTMQELSKPRADSMDAKSRMYSAINTLGQVSLKDVPVEQDDSLSKNLANTYLIGSGIYTNLINKEYLLPKTIKNKQRAVVRQS